MDQGVNLIVEDVVEGSPRQPEHPRKELGNALTAGIGGHKEATHEPTEGGRVDAVKRVVGGGGGGDNALMQFFANVVTSFL